MNDLTKRTWAEIDLSALSHNYHTIRSILPEGCRFLGVVKADAYGHGALRVARLLEGEGQTIWRSAVWMKRWSCVRAGSQCRF